LLLLSSSFSVVTCTTLLSSPKSLKTTNGNVQLKKINKTSLRLSTRRFRSDLSISSNKMFHFDVLWFQNRLFSFVFSSWYSFLVFVNLGINFRNIFFGENVKTFWDKQIKIIAIWMYKLTRLIYEKKSCLFWGWFHQTFFAKQKVVGAQRLVKNLPNAVHSTVFILCAQKSLGCMLSKLTA